MGSQGKAADGVSKQHDLRSKKKNADKFKETLESSTEGKLSQAKSDSANASMARIDEHQAPPGEPVQVQSKPPYDSQEGQQVPSQDQSFSPVPEDVDMPDSAPSGEGRQNFADRTPSRDDKALDDDLLTDLKSLSLGDDQNGKVDGWGSLGKSQFFIFQFGPRGGAKYRALRTQGYNTDGMCNISDPEERISQFKDKNERGGKHWRYTRANIVGIVGVAIEERKMAPELYKSSPKTWVKIKWQNIQNKDEKLLSESRSWIPKSDLVRLTDEKTAENQITQAWKQQEERYLRYQQQDGTGRRRADRSPTPCPLDFFIEQKRERRAASRALTPGAEASWRSKSSVPVSPGRNDTRSSESVRVKKEEEDSDQDDLFVRSSSTSKPSQSAKGKSPETRGSRPDEDAITFSKKEFFEERAEDENWDGLTEEELEKRKTIAKAHWLFHRKEMIKLGAIEVRE